jgi:hypothetical protein
MPRPSIHSGEHLRIGSEAIGMSPGAFGISGIVLSMRIVVRTLFGADAERSFTDAITFRKDGETSSD